MTGFRPTLVIRADASPSIGGGHIMRCWALAQAFQACGGTVQFVCAELPKSMQERLTDSGIHVEVPPQVGNGKEDAEGLLKVCNRAKADWILLDGYGFGPEYQKLVSRDNRRLLVLSDATQAVDVTATAVLNPNIFARRDCYPPVSETEFWLGSEFALLRKEFRIGAPADKAVSQEIRRILVTFGISDPNNMTAKVLDALGLLEHQAFEINVVVGDCNPNAGRLNAAYPASNIRWHHNVADMLSLMQAADLAITAGGSTTYELAACGVPMLVVAIAENQVPLAAELERQRAAVFLGTQPNIDTRQMATQINALMQNSAARCGLGQRASQLVDGRGAHRVVKRMLQQLLRIRAARATDAALLFQWQQDRDVRQWSFTDGPASLQSHTEWLAGKLSDPQCHLLICETESGDAIGMIRFDVHAEQTIVGLSLDPEYRGRGLGSAVLASGLQHLARTIGEREVVAYIKPENVASRKTFAAAGFELAATKEVHAQIAQCWVWRGHRPPSHVSVPKTSLAVTRLATCDPVGTR